MAQTFYWYDYETWGINPKTTRPSQFAGVRTDLDFNQIGNPLMIYNKPNDDFLPEPGAVMITGITPQKALEEGIPEAEFAKAVHAEMSKPGTISLGFNSIRFDEVFNRYLFWRNFYDPYAHSWKDDCSTWDIIDMVRLTRALRPEGLEWPMQDGKPTNRLEKLSVANGIEHADAHDALADVRATIAIAQKIKQAQPKLFNYVFTHRSKKDVSKLLDVQALTPVIHASDKFGSEVLSTGLVVPVAEMEQGRRILVFDLKTNPEQVLDLSAEEVAGNIFTRSSELPEGTERIGVKGIKLNASPVLAPESTLDDSAADRIKLDRTAAKKHLEIIRKHQSELAEKLIKAHDQDWPRVGSSGKDSGFSDAESKLYDGFVANGDSNKLEDVRNGDLDVAFSDERLQDILAHYKARNFPEQLSEEERTAWETYRSERLHKGSNNFEAFSKTLQEIGADESLPPEKQSLLEDLQLYAESIYPYGNV